MISFRFRYCGSSRSSLLGQLVFIFGLLYGKHFGWIARDDLLFGVGGDGLDGHVLQAREEDSLADVRLEEEEFLLVGEIEGLLHHVDVGGRLCEKQLKR